MTKNKPRKRQLKEKATVRSRNSAVIISRLKNEKNQFRRKFLFVGYLFDALTKIGAAAYLVGGEAVEIYTAGQFSTGDIDITTNNREAAIKLLRTMGFGRTGMIWLNTDSGNCRANCVFISE